MSPSRANPPLPRSHLSSAPSPGPHPSGSGELEATATKAPRWAWGGPAGSTVPGLPGQTPAPTQGPQHAPPPRTSRAAHLPSRGCRASTGHWGSGRSSDRVPRRRGSAIRTGPGGCSSRRTGLWVKGQLRARRSARGAQGRGLLLEGQLGPPPHPNPCSEDMSLLCAPECGLGGCGPRRPIGKRGQVASFLGTPAPCARALGQEGSSADSLPPLLLSAPLL